MDELHENRAAFVAEVRDALSGTLERYGLQLDSVSLTALDQTPFNALDENNAFNAEGMRKLAEVVATSRKQRAEIEAESEVALRKSAMEAAKRRLDLELEERRAEIAQSQEIETLLAAQIAEVARQKAEGELAAARARIRMEQEIQTADLAREEAIRRAEIAQAMALEQAEQDRLIQIAAKSQEESRAQAAADVARAEEAVALKTLKLAEAEATRARIEAENARSDAIVAMELEKARLEAMPKILAEVVKPAEKIQGISINHVSGLRGEDGVRTPVNQALDSILDMAVQLPALKKIGDAVGVNLQDGLGTATATPPEPKGETGDDS